MKYLLVIIFTLLPVNVFASIVINEIAWMGGLNSYNDEWIELHNDTDLPINLGGWILKAADGSPKINLAGDIPANSFYLLERSKDYTGALENNGEILELYDSLGNLIDKIDASSGWPAGDNETKQTMERAGAGWQTSQNPGGTPKTENSEITKVSPEKSYGVLPVEEKTPGNGPAETETLKPEKELAAIGEQMPKKTTTSFLVFLAAIFTSFASGGIILILKRKLKLS